MQIFRCELCGGRELIKQDGLFICQHCGTKYTAEEARKLLGAVKIDRSEETEKLLILARRAREEDHAANAVKYYDLVLRDAPHNWEANFYLTYFQAKSSKIKEIGCAADDVASNLLTTLPLVRSHVPEEEQDAALQEIMGQLKAIGEIFLQVAREQYGPYMGNEMRRREYAAHMVGVGSMYLNMEQALKHSFPEKTALLLETQRMCLSHLQVYQSSYDPQYHLQTVRRLEKEITEKDPSYRPAKRGCYIATCVYGSYDCAEVWTLRRFRDQTLCAAWYGRAFVRLYYAVSPWAVRVLGDTAAFRRFFLRLLDGLVRRLRARGVADTPYTDQQG